MLGWTGLNWTMFQDEFFLHPRTFFLHLRKKFNFQNIYIKMIKMIFNVMWLSFCFVVDSLSVTKLTILINIFTHKLLININNYLLRTCLKL